MSLYPLCCLLFFGVRPSTGSSKRSYRTRAIAQQAGTSCEPCPMRSDAYVTCMVGSGGVTSSLRECIGTEYQRVDVLLNASYKRKLARLSKPSQAKLRRDQRSWLKTRLDKCERDLEEDKDGTIWLIEMDNCALQELIRRTLWIERTVS
jgi:uncharacterized protein YecT (DUF1311 family)